MPVSQLTGLTSEQAAAGLERHGRNEIPHPPGPSWSGRVGRSVREPLVLVLLAAAGLTTVTGDLADTAVIAVVVLVNTSVAVWQEVRAERAVNALSGLASPTCRVVRDGVETLLGTEFLVPGDVVRLAEGDVVPADGRLVEAVALRSDEAALTGESAPVDKTVGAEAAGGSDGRPDDVVWAGTTVVHGRGAMVVTATGADSALGRIAGLIALAGVRTPLQQRLAQLSRVLAGVVVVLCLVVLVAGVLRGQSLELMVLTAISLVVAAVPESLPVVVTLSLALGARRMARRQAVARDLAAVETLGSVTLLATDKTGTLTEGSMTVTGLWAAPGARRAEVTDAVALCNDAHLAADANHHGDPTEVALLAAAADAGIDVAALAGRLPRIGELPFDSDRRRMTTLHRQPDGRVLVLSKGAPEVMLQAGVIDASPADLDAARRQVAAWARQGERVLAVARGVREREVDGLDSPRGGVPSTALPQPDALDLRAWERGLDLVGLVALRDPARSASPATVAACRRAGIRVVLVTGDGPVTAAAVARSVGIDAGTVVDLSEAPDLSRATGAGVLARAAPAQKRGLVEAWQERGEVVAMTGDGVNDGPALRRADIGVAMGRRGTEVARQAADLVLADDELGTVVRAVEEGRRVYANIRRFLLYGLSGGAAELLVMLAGPAVGMPVPLLPAQILWVNLLTHSLAGTALGAEPAEPGLLDRPPRRPDEGVLGSGLWWRVLTLAAWIGALSLVAGSVVSADPAVTTSTVQATVLLALGAGQLGVALGARARRHPAPRDGRKARRARRGSDRNRALPTSVAAALLLLVAAVQLEPLRRLLGTAEVSAVGWAGAAFGMAVGWLTARAAAARGM